MSETNKLNVFPTKDLIDKANETGDLIEKQLETEGKIFQQHVSEGELSAKELMAKRSADELERAKKGEIIRREELAEKFKNWDKKKIELEKKKLLEINNTGNGNNPPTNNSVIQSNSQNNNNPERIKYIEEISQPQFNSPYDVIPLPSEGKLYKSKNPTVKVSFLTTADENILTSPNLLNSGEFLEILINRKLLSYDLRYKDLHTGDRNAIMLWLRATAYGEIYPIIALDENTEPFEADVNLNDLKQIKLGAEPDAEGYFDFILPLSKIKIKFKLLTVGNVEEIELKVAEDEKKGELINKTKTYTLEKHIIEINGDRNPETINNLANNMRPMDADALMKYIDSIESGIDLEIEIGTMGGGSIKTFLPLNPKFFWPNVKL